MNFFNFFFWGVKINKIIIMANFWPSFLIFLNFFKQRCLMLISWKDLQHSFSLLGRNFLSIFANINGFILIQFISNIFEFFIWYFFNKDPIYIKNSKPFALLAPPLKDAVEIYFGNHFCAPFDSSLSINAKKKINGDLFFSILLKQIIELFIHLLSAAPDTISDCFDDVFFIVTF